MLIISQCTPPEMLPDCGAYAIQPAKFFRRVGVPKLSRFVNVITMRRGRKAQPIRIFNILPSDVFHSPRNHYSGYNLRYLRSDISPPYHRKFFSISYVFI